MAYEAILNERVPFFNTFPSGEIWRRGLKAWYHSVRELI